MTIDIKKLIEMLQVRTDLCLILLSLMLVDILCGVIRALYQKEFQSSIFREGLIKKFFEIIIVGSAYTVDYILNIHEVGLAVLIMLIGAELYSIIFENASQFVPIPQILKDFIEQLKGNDEKKKEEIDNGERL